MFIIIIIIIIIIIRCFFPLDHHNRFCYSCVVTTSWKQQLLQGSMKVQDEVVVNICVFFVLSVLVRKGTDGTAELVLLDHGLYQQISDRWVGENYTLKPRYWNIPVLLNTGVFLCTLSNFGLFTWPKQACIILKLTILEQEPVPVLLYKRCGI